MEYCELPFTLEFDFLPSLTKHEPDITPMFFKHYPPTMMQKHPIWYLPNADLFISIDGNLFGLYRHHFESSTLFKEILEYNKDYGIGQIPLRPIPFDDLRIQVFLNFLHFLHDSFSFTESNGGDLSHSDWMDVKNLCEDWYFPNQIGEILRMLYWRRVSKFPLLQRKLVQTTTYFQAVRRQREMRRNQWERMIIEEDKEIIEDNST